MLSTTASRCSYGIFSSLGGDYTTQLWLLRLFHRKTQVFRTKVDKGQEMGLYGGVLSAFCPGRVLERPELVFFTR